MTKKRHHYVPMFYLKGFTCIDNPKRIWVYTIDDSAPFTVNVTKTAVEKHFYATTDDQGNFDPDSIENHLDQKVESPANPVINKLRKRKLISDIEKKKLARYLTYMLTRVPANRERVRHDIPKRVSDAKRITQNTFEKSNDPKPLLLRDALQALDEIESGLIQELSLPHFMEQFYRLLNMMNWATFTAFPGSTFITSDNPFCYTEHVGLIDHESRFMFPLTSTTVLIGSWAPFPVNDFAIWYAPIGNQKENDSINRIMIAGATKYVFHNEKSEWVRNLIRYVKVNKML